MDAQSILLFLFLWLLTFFTIKSWNEKRLKALWFIILALSLQLGCKRWRSRAQFVPVRLLYQAQCPETWRFLAMMPQYKCLIINQEAIKEFTQTSSSENVAKVEGNMTSFTLYSSSLENEWVVIAAMFLMTTSKNKLF